MTHGHVLCLVLGWDPQTKARRVCVLLRPGAVPPDRPGEAAEAEHSGLGEDCGRPPHAAPTGSGLPRHLGLGACRLLRFYRGFLKLSKSETAVFFFPLTTWGGDFDGGRILWPVGKEPFSHWKQPENVDD